MNEDLIKLIDNLKENCGVYIGGKSLNKLIHFIDGYIQCSYEKTGVVNEFLPGFQEYIEKYYDIYNNVHLSRHWSDIIVFFNYSEENAFDKFYEHLDAFYKIKNMMNR